VLVSTATVFNIAVGAVTTSRVAAIKEIFEKDQKNGLFAIAGAFVGSLTGFYVGYRLGSPVPDCSVSEFHPILTNKHNWKLLTNYSWKRILAEPFISCTSGDEPTAIEGQLIASPPFVRLRQFAQKVSPVGYDLTDADLREISFVARDIRNLALTQNMSIKLRVVRQVTSNPFAKNSLPRSLLPVA
jgi:hypothetical protein